MTANHLGRVTCFVDGIVERNIRILYPTVRGQVFDSANCMNGDSNGAYESERQELFRSIFSYGDTAIRNALLINGGAAVAILAFIGNVVAKTTGSTSPPGSGHVIVAAFAAPLLGYVLAVFSAALASGAAYAAQFCYYHSGGTPRAGHFFRWLAILLMLTSYAGFVGANLLCYQAFLRFP